MKTGCAFLTSRPPLSRNCPESYPQILRKNQIEWVEMGGDEWWLKVTTAEHTVKVVFSVEEIADFANGGEGASGSKAKLRNAFASLAM
jgi:hypothetical protein